MFQEKINGARYDRKKLAQLLAELEEGDVMIVTRLDRLAHSTRDLLNTLAAIGAANATRSDRAATGGFDTLTDIARSYNVRHRTISRLR